MGKDFAALLRLKPETGSVETVVERLQQGIEEPEFLELLECGRRHDYAHVRHGDGKPRWLLYADYDKVLETPPPIPTLEAWLELPCGFFVMVGRDAVMLQHYLRWGVFLTAWDWQRATFATLGRFYDLFGAQECVVTNDENPAIDGFLNGEPYLESLRIADSQGEGEVRRFTELYWIVEHDLDIAFRPTPGSKSPFKGRWVRWPRDRPLPEGWDRASPIWDSKGYWRFVSQGAAKEAVRRDRTVD